MVTGSSKRRIDVHAHYLPLRYMDMLRAAGMTLQSVTPA